MAKSSKAKTVKSAGSALDMLVRQFSQPLACLRELVQNSIDAGTNHIEVSLVRDPELKCLKLSVADTGEGMTEEIINTQLTRLFASSKENDLTKVGKFGIGFVSVFSLDPEVVAVDTGREGQFWRVLFDKASEFKKFELRALPQSVEGTTVSIYLAEGRHKLPSLLAEVEKTLAFWCRHCRVDIKINGESIKEPFELEAPLQVFYEEPGTRMVVAATAAKDSFYGYYNQGLTLLEGTGSPIPHLSFKLDSRYFEHTLTRDNIIKNEDYEKAMAQLRRVATQQLPKRLFEELRGDRAEDLQLWDLLDVLPQIGVAESLVQQAQLFEDFNGQSYSLATLKGNELFIAGENNRLSQAVHNPKQKRLVLRLNSGYSWLSSKLTVGVVKQDFALCEAVPAGELKELLTVFSRLGAKLGARALTPVRWLHCPEAAPFLHRGPVGLIRWGGAGLAQDPILLNADGEVYASLLQLARWSPPLACQVILQHLLLLRPESEREALCHALSEGVLEQLA